MHLDPFILRKRGHGLVYLSRTKVEVFKIVISKCEFKELPGLVGIFLGNKTVVLLSRVYCKNLKVLCIPAVDFNTDYHNLACQF